MSLRQIRVILAALAAAFTLAVAPATSHAQTGGTATPTATRHQIPADWKGTLGVGMIGAELGFVLPAVAGMDQTWAYLVFPVIGAVGGGLAGHFGLETGNHTELAVASLTVGMILIIPTLVFTISETSYDPSEDVEQSGAAQRRRSEALAKLRKVRESGTGMLRLTDDGLALAAPGFQLVSGAAPGHESRVSGLSLSVLSGRF